MRRIRLLCAIGVSFWSAVVAGSQAAPPPALSAALRAHLTDERFAIVTSIRGLPLGVRDELQTLFKSRTLDIAEPGAEFQESAQPRFQGVAVGYQSVMHGPLQPAKVDPTAAVAVSVTTVPAV